MHSKICVSVKPSSGFKCYLLHFLSPSPKSKKMYPEKNSLHFGKWNFLTVRLKNFLNLRKWNPALLSPSSKNKKSHPKKIFYISGNENVEKTSYVFSKGSFSYVSKNENHENFFIFSKLKNLLFF